MGEGGVKILFLVYHNLVSHSGISKKILSQVDGLRASGADVRLCTLRINADGSKDRTAGEEVIRHFGFGVKAKIARRVSYSDIIDYVRSEGIGTVYIRYDINSDPFTVAFVRRLRRLGVKVLCEIPTYPYDGEFKGQSKGLKLQHVIDKCFRKAFFSHCHKAVVYVDEERVFGCPTIKISNGVDFGRVPLAPEPDFSGGLRMLSVANVHLWHGLDRLIAGMGAHPEIPCELHIVGDGLESIFEQYRSQIAALGLEERVKILGPMFGEALDAEFAWCNLAVGSLGRHRSGINSIKTLKNREYAARGRAFFYSEQDSDFDDAPYVFRCPADESPVDIPALQEFAASVALSPSEIRQSALPLSWAEQMKKVLKDGS